MASCNEATRNPVAPPESGPSRSYSATLTLDAQIHETIRALFPSGEGQAITARWETIVGELAAADQAPGANAKSARARLLDLVDYIQKKTPRIEAPSGETQSHAAARLVLLMSVYVYDGPAAAAPDISAASDAVLAVVQPSATTATLVQTPSGHAAVRFPPGSLGEARIVVIFQETTPYPVNCTGPLDTRLCQYPLFYDFSVFPDNRLLVPAVAAVCHINTGSSRVPLADHNRFRVAHGAPANEADRVAGGTIVDGIEILPFAELFGLTGCEGNSYDAGAQPGAPPGALGMALHWIVKPAQRLASAIIGQLAPRAAYAIDGLGGGELLVFSTFGIVDPESRPDLAVTSKVSGFEGSFLPGAEVPIGVWSVANIGTAAAQDVSVSVFVAEDTMLTSGVVASAELTRAARLAPRASLSGTGAAIVLPGNIVPGTYSVGVRVIGNSETGIPETNYFNNRRTTRITVSAPTVIR